jgi:hypothetical protein
MATTTPVLGLLKPVVGADDDLWGGFLNQNMDVLDAQVVTRGSGVAIVGTSPTSNVYEPLWWDSNSGQLFIQYDDGSSVQWVSANSIDASTLEGSFLPLTGGTMQGPLNYTATGGTVPRSAQDRAQSMALTVEDFGAKGDQVTDDTAAFNAYASYLRGMTGYFVYKQFTLGHSRVYVLRGSVNLTALSNLKFEGNGSCIVASPTSPGTVALDCVEANLVSFNDFTLIAEGANCKYGIQVGRAVNPALASTIYFNNIRMDGTFANACIYNRAAESSEFNHVSIQNRTNAATAYALIMDGDCTFPITSAFASTYNPGSPTTADGQAPGTTQSFNQQTFVSCSIISYHAPAIWMSCLRSHKYMNCYAAGWSQGGSGPIAVISYVAGGVADDLHWDVHCEPENITNVFTITGAVASPVMRNLYLSDCFLEATGSVFVLGAGVTSLTLHDLELHIENCTHPGVVIFDNPANYTILGCRAYVGPNVNFNGTPVQGSVNVNGTFPVAFNTGGPVTVPGLLTASGAGTGLSVTNAATIGGALSLGGGVHCGAFGAGAYNDFSKHLELYSGGGITVTGAGFNYVSGVSHIFYANGSVQAGLISSTGLNACAIGQTTAAAGTFLALTASGNTCIDVWRWWLRR